MILKRFQNNILLSSSFSISSFVPECPPHKVSDVQQLANFISNYSNICILSGAGVSTESGIPDYRSEKVGLYATSKRRPIQYQDFVGNILSRKRYWARSFLAWPKFSSFRPNRTHFLAAEWEKRGMVGGLITQNVDRLHQKAGSKNLVELHGTLYNVICLSCGRQKKRDEFQKNMESNNWEWKKSLESGDFPLAPDGDISLNDHFVHSFKLSDCESCGGIMKPDVVFFGESVPQPRVREVEKLIKGSKALLVLGSSLYVYSGFRFIQFCASSKIPIAMVNIGPTRADHLVRVKVEGVCSHVMQQLDSHFKLKKY